MHSNRSQTILVWLPTPMGDAIMCTPALRSIRDHFADAHITFYANVVTHDMLSPSTFCDAWIIEKTKNPLSTGRFLRKYNFDMAILMKNSFGSALAVFWAGIKQRIGYARDHRGIFLTEKLYPPKRSDGTFKPGPMIDYYLAIASWLGCDTADRRMQLELNPYDTNSVRRKLPAVFDADGPLVILVPGGGFGPSKCWPSERYAQIADQLIDQYRANIVLSVAPNEPEQKIACEICGASNHSLINLAEHALTLGELKSLFSLADLVICNDTGPRHIAIALWRKIITLFGPNDPVWARPDYPQEIEIVADVPCAPCQQPRCRREEHICMQSISVDRVMAAAEQLLIKPQPQKQVAAEGVFAELEPGFFVDSGYKDTLESMGLTTFEQVFNYESGRDINKQGLAAYRRRIFIPVEGQNKNLYLKRYNRPPKSLQIKNKLYHKKYISCGQIEYQVAATLKQHQIDTITPVAYGHQLNGPFEKRSFLITEELAGKSLEKQLPDYFDRDPRSFDRTKRNAFIQKVADLVRRFHEAGFRHRDLYLCHIFCDTTERLYLIDLARVFQPVIGKNRYKVKDLAQLYYSAPGNIVTQTDRLRFFLYYRQHSQLTAPDKNLIKAITRKVRRIAKHDKKHGRNAPFQRDG